MKIYKYPAVNEWKKLAERPSISAGSLEKKVKKIIASVKEKGDKAIRKYSKAFDGASFKELRVSDKEIKKAGDLLTDDLKAAILQAKNNIETFHKSQLQPVEKIQTMPGILCWRKSVPIETVGLYIPGGSAPLFSTILMLGIPAKLAGCKEIILCSPPGKEGKLHPAILFAAAITGITKIFRIGGVQAIAAMAYGSASVPRVSKIFGPGNQFVTAAKQLVQRDGIAIDMPAGPSEVAVFADETADPAFVAADLLSQAEHGPDSQVILVCNRVPFAKKVEKEVTRQLDLLPRKSIAKKALKNSKLIILRNEKDAVSFLNEYAPEHLIICCANVTNVSESIINAGSVFLGNYSPESAGDYASGTNHTLPTNGFAKAYSGVSVDSFVKKITFQELSEEGLENIANTIIAMAEAEGLQAHAEAVKIRIKSSDL